MQFQPTQYMQLAGSKDAFVSLASTSLVPGLPYPQISSLQQSHNSIASGSVNQLEASSYNILSNFTQPSHQHSPQQVLLLQPQLPSLLQQEQHPSQHQLNFQQHGNLQPQQQHPPQQQKARQQNNPPQPGQIINTNASVTQLPISVAGSNTNGGRYCDL